MRSPGGSAEESVQITADEALLEGSLAVPAAARGLVLFAHGSGSSRHSPRNRLVADVLQAADLGTLLMDLLTMDEEALDAVTSQLRFDIPLLARRLVGASRWVLREPRTAHLPIGYFGASTGAAAALRAAAEMPETVQAVVSRGGRPDLAGPVLSRVKAPTLLIVGGDDVPVIQLNREALERLQGERELVIVPRATHLFEEPGALEEVARLAADWFARHFDRPRPADPGPPSAPAEAPPGR